jgi:hypothetical protein
VAWLGVVALVSNAGRAAGQDAGEPPVGVLPPAPAAPTPPAATEVTLDRTTAFGAGFGVSGPLGAALSLRLAHGLGADVREDGGRVRAVCALPIPHCAKGFILQADVGSGGARLSLGVGARARIEDEDFRGTVGVSLRAALVRTFGSPLGTEPGLTYLGPELDLTVLRANLTLGVLLRLSGRRGASVLFSWGVGFGL